MPFGTLNLQPGVNVEATPTALRTGFFSSALVRFRQGFVEKIGGWVKFFPFALSGVPRALKAWLDLNGGQWLGIGTTTKLDVLNNGALTDITPQTLTTNNAPNFSTVINTTTVTIVDTGINNVTTLDTIELLTPISVGGLILSGPYAITAFVSATSYRIAAASNASSTVNNGGAVPSFTTVSGSSVVQVTLTAHGLSAGNSFVLPLGTSVGGITIGPGTFIVSSIIDANNFNIPASQQATSSAGPTSMNSGNAGIKYYIALGPPSASGTGWGIQGWGVVPWGGTGAAPASQTGTQITATDWTLDNWNATLMSCPANSGIYAWTPGSGFLNAQLVATAPLYNSGIFVAAPRLALLAYGSTVKKTIGVAQDPLIYNISDIGDFTFWSLNVNNPSTGQLSQAFQSRLPTGTAIKAGMAAPNQVLLWTDLDLYSIKYVNLPTIWTQSKIGSNCGTVSRHAIAQMGGIVYWRGPNNFYAMAGGTPVVMPCTVWDVAFQDVDNTNLDKCWIETITAFNEVWFWHPSLSGGSGQADTYVKVNVITGAWDYGQRLISRSIGIDQSLLGNPLMTSPQGIIYQHETGYNADGQPLNWSFTTGFFYLSEGQDYVFVDQFLPDFKYGTFGGAQLASVQISFSVINFQSDTPTVFGPYTINNQTDKINLRFRGRQVQITMTANDVGTFVRLGSCRFRFAQSGRR